MSKLTLAFLIFASTVAYKPAALSDALRAEMQSIGWQLRTMFDVGKFAPGLFHSDRG